VKKSKINFKPDLLVSAILSAFFVLSGFLGLVDQRISFIYGPLLPVLITSTNLSLTILASSFLLLWAYYFAFLFVEFRLFRQKKFFGVLIVFLFLLAINTLGYRYFWDRIFAGP